jgi:Domain of unknown function (DUF4873)
MEHHDDGYEGPATLRVDTTELPVTVTLAGHFEPIDGKYHWYGRIHPNHTLTTLVGAKKTQAHLKTPTGESTGALTDPDPWGRYRITGTTTPPFPTDLAPHELPAHPRVARS